MTDGSPARDPDVSFTFTAAGAPARDARAALRPMLREDGQFACDVQLAASEIVTNVIRHTEQGGSFEAWDEDPLVIEVSDFSRVHPRVRAPGEGVGGRGLAIVEHVASRWGVRATDTGKVVWASFARPSATWGA